MIYSVQWLGTREVSFRSLSELKSKLHHKKCYSPREHNHLLGKPAPRASSHPPLWLSLTQTFLVTKQTTEKSTKILKVPVWIALRDSSFGI